MWKVKCEVKAKSEMWNEIAAVDGIGALVDGNGRQSITVGMVGPSLRQGKVSPSLGQR